jgi:hypothetical protein
VRFRNQAGQASSSRRPWPRTCYVRH